MGLYSEKIFPVLLDWALSHPTYAAYRQEVLAEVHGEVLEIGFGTGLNLPHYPDRVEKVVTVDVNPGMNAIAQRRIQTSRMTVDLRVLNGESLPMAEHTFDSVVSTWTLCSIPQVEQALSEIYRVLKPGGRFFFIEHGLSPEPTIQTWQNRLTPLQKVIADGCHLNRNIQQLVEKQFDIVEVKTFYAKDTPKTGGYFYQGVGTKKAE